MLYLFSLYFIIFSLRSSAMCVKNDSSNKKNISHLGLIYSHFFTK